MTKQLYTPLDMPRGSKYGSDYFVAYSYKLRRSIKLYSNLEYKNWLTLEMNPTVKTFCEQPYEAKMLVNGKKKRTIFDMWVCYVDGREEFQEIKYSTYLTGTDKYSVRSQEQIQFQEKWCKLCNMPYVVWTEKEIEPGPFFIENLLHLSSRIKRYSHALANTFYENIQKVVSTHSCPIISLSQKFGTTISDNELLSIMAFAYYDGLITMNLNDAFYSPDTEVSLLGK